MGIKFNLNRPKITDEEIDKHKDFDQLVAEFKKQSLRKARSDSSWWKNKVVKYTTVIAGVTVVCTVTYNSLKSIQTNNKTNDKIVTHKSPTPKQTSTSKQSTRFVNPPSEKLKVPGSTFTVNNAKGATLTHKSTRISVPARSFVDAKGEEIVGEVTLTYNEYHDLAEIVASGIPMAYDSAATKYQFESAGMFDIRGYNSEGDPVFIHPDKKLQVQMASFSAENRFNQYYLDTVARNWQYLQHDRVAAQGQPNESNSGKKPEAALQKIKKELEIIPLRIDSARQFSPEVTTRTRPQQPAAPRKPTAGRPSFKLDGSYNDFPELKAFDNVLFEVGPENRNYSRELHEITWSDVKITQGPVPGKNYVLHLSHRSRKEQLIVYPVLSGADLQKAEEIYKERLQEYNQIAEKQQENEKRLLAEMEQKQKAYVQQQLQKQKALEAEKARIMASFDAAAARELSTNFRNMSQQVRAVRLFEVSRFGIFNSDCPHAVPGGKVTNPVFVAEEGGKPLRAQQVFLVDHTKRSVFGLSADEQFAFASDPSAEYSICVFSNKKLYLCKKEEATRTLRDGQTKFYLQPLGEDAEDLQSLRKALEI